MRVLFVILIIFTARLLLHQFLYCILLQFFLRSGCIYYPQIARKLNPRPEQHNLPPLSRRTLEANSLNPIVYSLSLLIVHWSCITTLIHSLFTSVLHYQDKITLPLPYFLSRKSIFYYEKLGLKISGKPLSNRAELTRKLLII